MLIVNDPNNLLLSVCTQSHGSVYPRLPLYNLHAPSILQSKMSHEMAELEALALVKLLIQQGHYTGSVIDAAKQILTDVDSFTSGLTDSASPSR